MSSFEGMHYILLADTLSSSHSLRTVHDISQRLAELKTLQANPNTLEDTALASATSNVTLADGKKAETGTKAAQQSIKESARARMLQRLEELEKV